MIDFMKSSDSLKDSQPSLENFINAGKRLQPFNENYSKGTEAFQTVSDLSRDQTYSQIYMKPTVGASQMGIKVPQNGIQVVSNRKTNVNHHSTSILKQS